MKLTAAVSELRTYLIDTVTPSAPSSFVGFLGFDNIVMAAPNQSEGDVVGMASVVWGSADKIEAGAASAAHRQDGMLQLVFKAPADTGDGELLDIATHFRNSLTSRSLTPELVLLTAYPTNRGLVNGWFEYVLTCPFEVDFNTQE